MYTTTSAPAFLNAYFWNRKSLLYLIKRVISKRSPTSEASLITFASSEVSIIHPSFISIDPSVTSTARYMSSTHICMQVTMRLYNECSPIGILQLAQIPPCSIQCVRSVPLTHVHNVVKHYCMADLHVATGTFNSASVYIKLLRSHQPLTTLHSTICFFAGCSNIA